MKRWRSWALCWLLAGWMISAEGAFKSGAAVRVVTPEPLLPVSGGVGASKPVREKKGDLTVRALAIEDDGKRVVFVGTDFLGFPGPLCDKVRARVNGVPAENILIGATHTHSAPDPYGFVEKPEHFAENLKYLDMVVAKAAEAINEAVAGLTESSFSVASGPAKGKIAYNYYAEQLYDPRCNVIQTFDKNGKTIATLVNYAIHPEVLGNSVGILSPDLCGPLYDRIAEKGGGVAVFMNGAQGGMVTADNRGGAGEKDIRTWEECVRIGTLLADEALRIAGGAPRQTEANLHVAARTVSFPVESPILLHVLKTSPLAYATDNRNSVSTRLNLVNLGDAQIVTIPGEALPNIGYYLKRKMRGKHNFLFGLTNDAFGYILTKEDFNSFDRYAYVTRTSLGEKTAEIMQQALLEMIEAAPTPAGK